MYLFQYHYIFSHLYIMILFLYIHVYTAYFFPVNNKKTHHVQRKYLFEEYHSRWRL